MKHRHYSLGFEPLKSDQVAGSFKPFFINWSYFGHYLNPKTYYLWFKRFCERGFNGYSSSDYWDADSYFENVLLGVIKDLKKNTIGFPCQFSDFDMGQDISQDITDSGMEKWQSILQEIIDGIEATQELKREDTVPKGIYSDGPWHFKPLEDNPELFTLVDESDHTFNQEAFDEWQKPLLLKKKRAMLLICKHWGSFWD